MKKMITMMLVVFIVAALMILAVSCGSPNTSTAETKAAEQENEETAAAVETTAAVETKAAEAVTEAARDCPSSTSVKVESTNGAYEDRMPINWETIGSQAAYLSNTQNNTGLFIYIANFETSENLKEVDISDGQAMIEFVASIPGEGDPVPVSIGKYNVIEWVDTYVSANIILSGGSKLQIYTTEVETGDFEITSVTDTEICGKFNIDEKWTKMSGEFKVPIVK